MSRFVNLALFVLVVALTITGAAALVWSEASWLFEAHRIAGWALVVLTPLKVAIAWRSYRRGAGPPLGRSLAITASSLAAGLTILVAALAFAWMWRLGPDTLALAGRVDTLMSWHWILGFVLFPLFLAHSWITWPRPRRSDLVSRRAFLRLAGLGAAAVAGWAAGGIVAARRDRSDAPRRASGSRRAGSFAGNDFPVTTGAGDGREPVDQAAWRLTIDGRRLRRVSIDYAGFLDLPTTVVEATLDCTIGWYTEQHWRGVALVDLLRRAGSPAAAWVRVTAAGGYRHVFSPREAERLVLATHVGDEPLSHAHGFPVRLVAPGRKGWFWVKWVERIEAL